MNDYSRFLQDNNVAQSIKLSATASQENTFGVSSYEIVRHEPIFTNGYTVLLVEDDFDDQVFTRKSLEQSKYIKNVEIFGDGDVLLDYFLAQDYYDHNIMSRSPTMIILDVNLPKMNGFKVLEFIKGNPFIFKIPVVVLSGDQADQKVMKAFELGADGFLSKPFNLSKLEKFFCLS